MLATHGVLFLDEMGEFPVAALEALRQPLEEGVIRVSRAGGTVTFPAQFLLVAAMNPCPCGEGVFPGACACSLAERSRYTRRLSAPLLDRFDLVVPLSRPDPDQLLDGEPGESTAASAARVRAACARAAARSDETEPPMHPGGARLLAAKLREGALTARGLHKVSRVARTVADLVGSEQVGEDHVCDALNLRAARATVAP
jgi:magnesium chelatase family protein